MWLPWTKCTIQQRIRRNLDPRPYHGRWHRSAKGQVNSTSKTETAQIDFADMSAQIILPAGPGFFAQQKRQLDRAGGVKNGNDLVKWFRPVLGRQQRS